MNKNNEKILREKTSLSSEDCFLVMQRAKQGFYYPLHVHAEFELNYLENASGALRIVGDSIEEIDDLELVLIAGETKHAYTNHTCKCKGILEITIQFDYSLFESLLDKRHFESIRNMFANASSGVVFSKQAILNVQDSLKLLSKENPESFQCFIRMIEVLKELSLDSNARRLNPTDFVGNYNKGDADRLEGIMIYLHENYQSAISLSGLASEVGMSESSLTRFLKRWTGKTFIDNLNDIRITNAVNRLVDTRDSISEICYRCGFNNLSNFNRIFKKRKGYTPKEYREKYPRIRSKI